LVLSIPLVWGGQLPGVMLAVLTLAALSGFEAVMPLPQAALTLSSSLQSAKRIFGIVDAPSFLNHGPVIETQAFTTVSSLFVPLISFQDLSFSYPGSSQPAVSDINFDLPPGKRIAVVGPSGAGKSTLANLLLRFWDYSHGGILLDGRDLREYRQDDVRSLFSFISQRTYYFNDTIRQNLLLALPAANESDLQEAVQRAHLHEFITGLPKGYETVIGEGGLRLSGGERQRLAIARALLKDAPIFMLDEPTANLDTVTEWGLLESLFSATQGHSILLMTHRLVGLEAMDEILVMDNGRIEERGTHARLLERNGLYCRLYDLQNRMLREE